MKFEVPFKNLDKEYDLIDVRRFKDMKDRFKDTKGIKGNPVIYRVYRKDFGKFEIGFNVMEPGNINGEFFMTKGHKHRKKRKELYILFKGKGKLLIEGKTSKLLKLKKRRAYFIPSDSGHRLINTGSKKLKVLTIYSKDSGRDYCHHKFKKRVLK